MIWNNKKRKVNFCGWFIHRTIRWILLFLIWPSELRGQHCTRAVLHKSDCFEYPLKFLLKSSYNQKCLQIFIFSKVSYPQRNPVMKKFKTKKKSLYHLGVTSTLPSPSKPRLGPGLGSNIIVCGVVFGCWKWFDTFPPSSVCPGFCQFGNILMRCAIVLQYAV